MHEGEDATDEVDAAVAAARAQFIAGFERGCDAIATSIDTLSRTGSGEIADELAQRLHRIGGLGGTIGLPTVSARARDFEDVVRDARENGWDETEARRLLDALRDAFRDDTSS